MRTINYGKKYEKYSSNKEGEICLKTSYEGYTTPGIKPSYAQIFRMIDQLEGENSKLRECT